MDGVRLDGGMPGLRTRDESRIQQLPVMKPGRWRGTGPASSTSTLRSGVLAQLARPVGLRCRPPPRR
ncbi:hypothetical protein ACRAWF_16815 [Streptomyces sp. L7]